MMSSELVLCLSLSLSFSICLFPFPSPLSLPPSPLPPLLPPFYSFGTFIPDPQIDFPPIAREVCLTGTPNISASPYPNPKSQEGFLHTFCQKKPPGIHSDFLTLVTSSFLNQLPSWWWDCGALTDHAYCLVYPPCQPLRSQWESRRNFPKERCMLLLP